MFPLAHGALLVLVDGQQDVGLLSDIGQADRRALAQRVVGGQSQAPFGVELGFVDDIRVREVGGEHHGHVEATVQQALFDGLALPFVDVDGDFRVPMF